MFEVFTVWFHKFRNVKGDKKRLNILLYLDPKTRECPKWKWTSSKHKKKIFQNNCPKKSEKNRIWETMYRIA